MAMRSYRTASGRTVTESGMQYGDRAFTALGQELYRENTDIMRDSLPLVPVDTGALRASGYVAEPERQGDHVICEVGYGGVATQINPITSEPTTAYALAVHENLQAHHKVGQAHYLQQPFEAALPGMPARVAAGMRQRLSGTGAAAPVAAP